MKANEGKREGKRVKSFVASCWLSIDRSLTRFAPRRNSLCRTFNDIRRLTVDKTFDPSPQGEPMPDLLERLKIVPRIIEVVGVYLLFREVRWGQDIEKHELEL